MNNILVDISNQAITKVVEKVRFNIANKKFPNNRKIIEICAAENINLVSAENDPHFIHEILETAVNQHLERKFKINPVKQENSYSVLAELENLTKNLPPQSWRGREMTIYQQFSTPPPIAFVMAQMLKPEEGKTALEPSAGTGSLAIWLRIAECLTFVNEISERRSRLLEIQNYQPTKVNAEFLDDLLLEEIKPDFVLMNPPFSASGGRVKTGDSNFGFRHIKSALARLKTGGRLVALLGNDSVTKSDKGPRFLSEIAADYDLRAVITLPKSAYYKYGTNFQTCIVCIKKPEKKIGYTKANKNTLEATCRNLEECLSFTDVFDR